MNLTRYAEVNQLADADVFGVGDASEQVVGNPEQQPTVLVAPLGITR